jgi:HK97 family phage portal protein
MLGASERRSAPAAGTLGDPWTALILGGSGPTNAGIEVTPERAMRCAAVFGAVKVLAETLAQLPLHLYRRTEDGGRERATDHPLEALLSDAANPWTPASEFRLVMQAQLALHGNAFAFINRNGEGEVAELIALPAGHVAVKQNPRTMAPIYTVTSDGGEPREYGREDILHIRGVGTSLYRGDSPVVAAREAIGVALVMEQHAAGLFGRGARPAGVLKAKGRVGQDTLERLKASWTQQYSGGNNAGRTPILEEEMDFKPLTLNSVDTQFLELRKFQLQEIARIWRVPLHLLADLERVTHSNAEQMGSQFVTYCILPITRAWTDAMRLSLLTPEERRAGLYLEFMLDDLARADLAGRFTSYSKAVASGILNPNEVRAMENRAGYVGGEVFTRPVNSAPVNRPPKPAGGANAQ